MLQQQETQPLNLETVCSGNEPSNFHKGAPSHGYDPPSKLLYLLRKGPVGGGEQQMEDSLHPCHSFVRREIDPEKVRHRLLGNDTCPHP
ncbi:hypothetical protein CDAR_540361 [Caerostris darwini]|uniref:Uncharacterized protein n=1 Tax=Caerostris darwini TaxID=1538125 RepID=A0AAV4WUH1_9ARAC|nr:hypothetical protein CDAR_540361 [Caerostris darwini]